MGGTDGQRADDLIGTDRDSAQIAQTLTDGTSIVLIGTLGSGKSHLIRDLVTKLRREGVDPLVLHSGGPLSGVPLGALDATRDPRAEQLRTGTLSSDEPRPVVIIDDAHELDDASAAAVVRAVYGGQATALFALTVTRDGNPTHRSDSASAAQMTIDLWLRGLAERIDLAELVHPDAEELVAMFGGAHLDALSRATVVGLADGSRMLLREFTREAVLATSAGRDAIVALREARPHSRVADAVAAHVSQLTPDERTALAILGRVPRIAFAHAVRLVPVDVLEVLIASRLVYDDGTADRLLTANAALARGCERACDSDDVRAAVARAVTRMLQPEADWWSAPIARRVATVWLRGEGGLVDQETVSEDVRVRVALDAARSANDTGDHDLAASIARWGLSLRTDLRLRIEAAFADAGRGESVDVAPLVDDIAARGLDCVSMLRWVRMSGPLIMEHPGVVSGATLAAVADASCADSLLSAELELIRAQTHAVALDWDGALTRALELSSRVGASASVRMRAAVVVGLCHASLGDSGEAHKWFLRARRLAGERDGIQPTTTQERLWAFSSEILAHGVAGTDARATLSRLDEEYAAAALEGDPATGAFVGLVAAAAAASIGEVDRAETELRAAVRRANPPQFGTILAYTEMIVARALALHGRVGDARAVLDLADTTLIEGLPLLDHARLSAETCVLAAEGRDGDAMDRARAATAVAQSAPVLLARDLFLLLALGDKDDRILPRIRHIAQTTSVPVTRVLDDRARELVSARAGDSQIGGFEALRMGTVWGVGDGQRDWMRKISPPPHSAQLPGSRSAVYDLTRREREIALLVAEGLSNREIATRLYLSVRTVESHIYQARAKVDAPSRGDLGRLVARASDRGARGI